MNKERSLAFMFWFTLILVMGGVGACHTALPSNLEEFALSPPALARLQARR